MKIQLATAADQESLLALMRESFDQDGDPASEEWQHTEAAIKILLRDPHAGEAYLTFDDDNALIGYIIMCHGFSLDYGGYFTWVEETYLRQSDQGRFRDERFSP